MTCIIGTGATKSGWSARVTRLDADSLLAVLNVPPATADFAGNYSCGSPSLQMASVTLHVLNGTLVASLASCNTFSSCINLHRQRAEHPLLHSSHLK